MTSLLLYKLQLRVILCGADARLDRGQRQMSAQSPSVCRLKLLGKVCYPELLSLNISVHWVSHCLCIQKCLFKGLSLLPDCALVAVLSYKGIPSPTLLNAFSVITYWELGSAREEGTIFNSWFQFYYSLTTIILIPVIIHNWQLLLCTHPIIFGRFLKLILLLDNSSFDTSSAASNGSRVHCMCQTQGPGSQM